METIQKNTCIKFVKKGHDNFKNYVEIKRGPAESDVGFHGIKHITYVGKQLHIFLGLIKSLKVLVTCPMS